MQKISVMLILALVVPASAAFAQVPVAVRADTEVAAELSAKPSDRANDRTNAEVQATGSLRAADTDEEGGDDSVTELSATSSAKRGERGATTTQGEGELHRSNIASFVQSLLLSADREGGIGAEVRAIARSQEESASTTAQLMARMENRSALRTLFFGADWKSIGELRSQIARSEADKARLERAISASTDASVKADLEVQLAVLEAEQARMEAFIEAHESRFSLFGWVTKLFVRSDADVSASTTSE